MPIELAFLTPERVPAAAEVERTCLSTAWSESQIASLPPEAVYLTALASESGALCGIGCLYCVAGEAELQNLAVLPAYRRRGVAQALLTALFAEARKRNCESVFLEVAAGNEAAQTLYRKNGFVPVGRRPGFYRGEDAVLMKKGLET